MYYHARLDMIGVLSPENKLIRIEEDGNVYMVIGPEWIKIGDL